MGRVARAVLPALACQFGLGVYGTYWFHRRWREHAPERPRWALPLVVACYVLSPLAVLVPVAVFFQFGLALGSILEGGDPGVLPGLTGNQSLAVLFAVALSAAVVRLVLHREAGRAMARSLGDRPGPDAPLVLSFLGPLLFPVLTSASVALWRMQLDATAS